MSLEIVLQLEDLIAFLENRWGNLPNVFLDPEKRQRWIVGENVYVFRYLLRRFLRFKDQFSAARHCFIYFFPVFFPFVYIETPIGNYIDR